MNRTLLTSGYATPSTLARLAAAALTLALAACAIASPPLPAFTPFAEPAVGLDQRAAQVRRAASGLGWTVGATTPGRMELHRVGTNLAVDFTDRHFVLSPGGGPVVDELRRSVVAQSGI